MIMRHLAMLASLARGASGLRSVLPRAPSSKHHSSLSSITTSGSTRIINRSPQNTGTTGSVRRESARRGAPVFTASHVAVERCSRPLVVRGARVVLTRALSDENEVEGCSFDEEKILLVVGADVHLAVHAASELARGGAARVDVALVTPSPSECKRNPAARALQTVLLGDTYQELVELMGFDGDDSPADVKVMGFPSCLPISHLGETVVDYDRVALAVAEAPAVEGTERAYRTLSLALRDELEGALAERGFGPMRPAPWLAEAAATGGGVTPDDHTDEVDVDVIDRELRAGRRRSGGGGKHRDLRLATKRLTHAMPPPTKSPALDPPPSR